MRAGARESRLGEEAGTHDGYGNRDHDRLLRRAEGCRADPRRTLKEMLDIMKRNNELSQKDYKEAYNCLQELIT